jgi:hypothetical protein
VGGSGEELFARYAYPPNALGYCGPDGEGSLLARQAAGVGDERFVRIARAFDGAWPYLELIAMSCGVTDPLDGSVVEAYWIGGPALERVEAAAFGAWIDERFGAQPGVDWALAHALVEAGAVPHHSFHVLAVYPWLGLLRSGHQGRPLEVLDRCRIRWGTVLAVDGDAATVRCRLLTWDGRALELGEPEDERADAAIEGSAIVPGLEPGDRVALHWGWICGRLDEEQVGSLRAATLRHLDLVNATAV